MPYIDGVPFQHGSDTSRDAALKARKFIGQQGDRVLAWVASRGAYGATQKEASEGMGIGRPSIAARFNALWTDRELVKTEERRAGCFVYLAAGR